jgi:delta-aminolevulinic acid dehydratase/porphobilinogen synthase
MNDWKKERKIAQMPGVARTVVNTLAATLEKAQAGHIKAVYIGIQWEDDTFCGDWSSQPRKDLAVHALIAQQNALSEIDQGGEPV